MPFAVFTDGCSNLPGEIWRGKDIHLLPCSYTADGVPATYTGDLDTFEAHTYYNQLRAGSVIKTSLLNSHVFLTHFRPVLEQGKDVVYVGMSSGISGTIQAARMAAEELEEEFPERSVCVVDSLGAGFGPGLLSCRACDLRDAGKTAKEAAAILDDEKMRMCEYFTVDDLNCLKRTGRVSGATAMIATVLNIKPLLYGDNEGHIVACGKVRGRRKAMDAIVEKYRAKVVDAQNQRVAISHGDVPEEAQELASRICQIAQPKELIIAPHEPVTGAHVGPGMLALFFMGDSR